MELSPGAPNENEAGFIWGELQMKINERFTERNNLWRTKLIPVLISYFVYIFRISCYIKTITAHGFRFILWVVHFFFFSDRVWSIKPTISIAHLKKKKTIESQDGNDNNFESDIRVHTLASVKQFVIVGFLFQWFLLSLLLLLLSSVIFSVQTAHILSTSLSYGSLLLWPFLLMPRLELSQILRA